ncbi:phosphatase PAP2 family protein [Bradyrhizobium sp. URHD0069]|uniref:phosphatase PAP2 family protein n=1 Tax=Bradyrhizobium sp. URHD0069 TaxID=1380355 RepID=UPI0018CC0725|nr:phosphatase PAP2 family protein [Bradyrhizobium sp. URHD0069]
MTDFLAGLDVSIFRALNDFCGWNPTFDRIVVHLEVIRGSLFMGIVGGLWYWADDEMPRRRETLLTMIPAVAVALVVNRVISMLLPFRTRPMYSIGANAPSFEWHADLENWSSFPSDNATYLFTIAASFWLISRWGGLAFGVFAAFATLGRVYLGIHYPSDILVGALIGIATSLVVNREPVRRLIAAPILALEPRYPAYFYGLFFIALAELSGTFPATRRIAVAIVHFITGYSRQRIRSAASAGRSAGPRTHPISFP